MTSSASKPSTPTCRIRSASSTSRSSGSCPENSVGVAERPALYSGYSAARKVLRDTSKATPDVGGRLVAQHVDQHRGEAVDGVRVLAGARREVLDREGEEGAVGQRVSVEEEELHAWQPSHHDRHHRRPRPGHARDRPRPDVPRPAAAAGDEPRLADAADGHRDGRGEPRAARRDHARRGQHPALRPAARRRLGGARRDPRLVRRRPARRARARPSSASTSTPPTTGRPARAWSPASPRRSAWAARWPATRSSSPTRTAGASARAGSPA